MINHPLYTEDLKYINEQNLDYSFLDNKTILITGASGLIGSQLVDALIYRNIFYNSNIKIITNGRNGLYLQEKYGKYKNFGVCIYEHDISKTIDLTLHVDYIIHAASDADPKSFKNNPMSIMKANFTGMMNILDYSKKINPEKIIYISSGEVYGCKDNIESYKEEDLGYVDHLSTRGTYPTAKRATENLCINSDENIIIARPCHTYGPTAKLSDSRASQQFITTALNHENIVLNGDGKDIRTYCYGADCITGLLYLLKYGKKHEAYNIANKNFKLSIYELAKIIATELCVDVEFKKTDTSNNNPMNKAILDGSKLESLGWSATNDPNKGFCKTIKIRKNF